jgi:surfeit locus 1 family protein
MGDVADAQQHDADGSNGQLTRTRGRITLAALCAALALLFAALGVWQVERRAWKLQLIAAVNARAFGPAVAAPGPAAWPRITAADHAYLRVTVSGRFDHQRATRVTAVTGRGEGAWLLTPLVTTAGWTVLVNRGFVPAGPAPVGAPAGPVTVTGLLRVTEPGGTILRPNDPAAERWYSRDIAAIAARRGLRGVAPYFIDADAAADGYPVGGLTVIAFRNNHLAYALTWFALAAFCGWACWRVVRDR